MRASSPLMEEGGSKCRVGVKKAPSLPFGHLPHKGGSLWRPWPSGQARASHVRQAGSTPAGRSRESANRQAP